MVDTGIHALGWPRQEAIDYHVVNTALSLHHVTTEIDRYIRNPGQALAYKLGQLEISQQRRRAEDRPVTGATEASARPGVGRSQ